MIVDQLWELLEKWYRIASNEAVHPDTRHGYRECANQLDDLLGIYGEGNRPAPLESRNGTMIDISEISQWGFGHAYSGDSGYCIHCGVGRDDPPTGV